MALTDAIPLGRRKVSTQFLCRSARTVARGVALDTPSLFQRACVYRIEAELVEQMGHSGFGVFVVTSDDQRAAILRACWFSVSSKVSGINMVEGFDDLRGWQMGLQRIRPCGELMPLRLFGSTTIDRSAGMEKANTRGTADATGGRRRRAWRAIQRRSGGPAMSLSSRRKKATKLRRNLKSAHAKCRLIQLEEGEANQLLRSCMLIGHIADATKRCDRPAPSS